MDCLIYTYPYEMSKSHIFSHNMIDFTPASGSTTDTSGNIVFIPSAMFKDNPKKSVFKFRINDEFEKS